MSQVLLKEMDKLKTMFLSLGTLVEENLQKAMKALESKESNLAQEVIDEDQQVDQIEVDLEEECLKILALYQPVAGNLRFIIAILKINNDLERIGDLAVNIAKRVILLADKDLYEMPILFNDMLKRTQEMLKKSMDALINSDPDLAFEVCASDDDIDETNRNIFSMLKTEMKEQPEKIDTLIIFLSISRILERVADYATNIAEDVIYMVNGEIVRHKTEYIKKRTFES